MAAGQQCDPIPQLSEEIKALIRGANFAHLATLMRDGAPQVAPVWVDLEGDAILVCTGTGSLKAKNTQRDARVGLSVIATDNPYQEAQLRGRIVERRPDPDFIVTDRVSRKYTGRPFPWRDKPAERLVLVIAVERAATLPCPLSTRPRSVRAGVRVASPGQWVKGSATAERSTRTAPNLALEPTANSVRSAPAVGGGSPLALGVEFRCALAPRRPMLFPRTGPSE